MRSSVAFGLAALLLATGCGAGAGSAAPPAVSASAGGPEAGSGAGSADVTTSGDATHSANVTLMANVPPQAPLDGPQSWGTDLAFQGDHVFVGNYDGFSVFDVSDPARPRAISRVSCPGEQNDVSVHGNLLFLSVDSPRGGPTCEAGSSGQGGAWEGIRIFDVTDKAHPRFVSAVSTDCGSHTHTLIPGESGGGGDGGEKVYLYVSSPGPEPESKTCPAPHNKISVVEVPTADPAGAKVVSEPVLSEGEGEEGLGGCHDITAYPEKDLAAAACFGDGLLMDISDRVHPKVLQRVRDEENFSIWHSATFNNAATKVVFGDELGGGVSATCDDETPKNHGADAVYDLTRDRVLRLRGYFKIPRKQQPDENCVAHNGSLLPVPGRDIMVQAWYQGGVSIWDFTDADHPREIGFFERGPVEGVGGSWSAYYYNGHIYSSDITRGLDVLRIDDPLTDAAEKVVLKELNAQTQVSYPE
ncbi:LVIVD repeat-containing protein [Streptosporangium sp. CA-135522]|uniref:LVIVD repeat-containing protein n=1 Tax=Streptosporangium sp. CA-135522 TaxID=3240072 RepID=UPI003D908790